MRRLHTFILKTDLYTFKLDYILFDPFCCGILIFQNSNPLFSSSDFPGIIKRNLVLQDLSSNRNVDSTFDVIVNEMNSTHFFKDGNLKICWAGCNTYNAFEMRRFYFYSCHNLVLWEGTLLVSRSEYPRDKPFLLTMVSYLKKKIKI